MPTPVSQLTTTKVKLTSDLIYAFSGSLLSPRYDEPAPTPDCHREWWDLCCSTHKRVAIAAPRGHAKSTAITKAYTLAAVLFRDRQYVLVVSDTWKQAVLFLGEIKQELSDNEDLKALFGVKSFITDREDDIVVEMTDGYKFKIMALGSEQKVRGLLWNGMRPDLIVGDDLENDEIVMNPERREKFRLWVNNALLPALKRRGVVRFVGTILHMDSMLERFMPKDRDKNSITFPLKVTMKAPKNGWFGVRYKAHDDSYKHILWPIKWDKERLDEAREVFIGQGNPEGYYQEYLNRPIDPHNAFFKKDDFRDYEEQDYERDWGYSPTYLVADLALSKEQRRDWCAFIIGSTDDAGFLYIRHVIRDRMDSKEIVETISNLQHVYKFNTFIVGKGAIEKSIGPYLMDEMGRRGAFLDVHKIPESVDKRLRAAAIRGRMRAGGVKFNKKAKWYSDLEQEMLEFDRGAHDDQVDAMALFGMYLNKMQDAPSSKEIEDEVYEEEKNKYWGDNLEDGRSIMTGY